MTFMSNQIPRPQDTVDQGRVKLHLFQPSKRLIWTVIGTDNEYWADLQIMFCSCKSYYYKPVSGMQSCYHLQSLALSIAQNKFDKIEFHDSEYNGFIRALISDHIALLDI